MNIIETLAYAGLGMASEASDKAKAKFDKLVETGKKVDSDGKNYVGDFFKTIDSTKDDIQTQFDKNKEKLEETFPFLKELEEKFMQTKEDLTSKAKDAKDDLATKAKETKEKIASKLKNIDDAEVISEEA